MLDRDAPRQAARSSIAEQAHLRSGDSFVDLQGLLGGELVGTDVPQQELHRFRQDRLCRHQLMGGVDAQIPIHDVQQCRGVDHLASHRVSVRRATAQWAALKPLVTCLGRSLIRRDHPTGPRGDRCCLGLGERRAKGADR